MIVETIVLEINRSTLEEYFRHYKKLHPRARKNPIEKFHHPSINQWAVWTRMKANKVKQDYKDFIVWLVDKNGYSNHRIIDKCEVEYHIYFDNHIRRDNDNYAPKFIMDGVTESGLWVDDDSKHVKKLSVICDFDKENPRSELIIFVFKYKEENEYDD